MNKLVVLSLVFLGGISYLAYESIIVKPKILNDLSKSMLSQIGVKEKWFDAFKVMDGSIVLSRHIESSFEDANTVHTIGKIEYTVENQYFCKYVDFNFKVGSLNNYQINNVSNCLN